MNEENNTVSTEIHYNWTGYQTGQQETMTVPLGGESQFVFAEVGHNDDGSLSLNVVSNGIGSKFDLTKFVGSIHTIIQHDYLEGQKQEREE